MTITTGGYSHLLGQTIQVHLSFFVLFQFGLLFNVHPHSVKPSHPAGTMIGVIYVAQAPLLNQA
jgi:hypothetical protein